MEEREEAIFETDFLAALDRLPVEDVTLPPPISVEVLEPAPRPRVRGSVSTPQSTVTVIRGGGVDEYVSQEVQSDWSRSDWTGPESTAVPVAAITTAPVSERKYITRNRLDEIAIEIFGEDRVSVEGSDQRYTVKVHFPLINIININGNKHVIKDLYVILDISTDMRNDRFSDYNVGFKGVRSTLSCSEARSKYAHSHLPVDAACGTPNDFCLGNSALKIAFMELSQCPSEERWYLILLSLQPYLEWESLEGGPHIKITAIGAADTRRNSTTAINYEGNLRDFSDNIPNNLFYFIDRLDILDDRARFEEIYRTYSPIKRLPSPYGVGPDAARDLLTHWKSTYYLRFTFKELTPNFYIYSEDGEQQDDEDTTVDPVIVMAYNDLLALKMNYFNKKIHYEYAKFSGSAGLGEVPFIQQTDIDRHKRNTGKDSITPRQNSRKGVVGRIDYLRKREDYRFG